MRELLEDFFQEPLDPTEAARRGMRPQLRKRFYKQAAIKEEGDAFHVVLDGRPIRTPGRRPLAAPSRALAQEIAQEWEAQGEVIDPASMPLTRLANTIIDGVASTSREVAAEIARYLGSDLLVYRAPAPEALVQRQALHWDPILAWARDTLDARFVLAEGVTFVKQPSTTIEAVSAAIPIDPWRLGAVHVITTLTGSALIALALASDAISVDEAWAAAHVDEDWNMERWGQDELALARRSAHRTDMQAAAITLKLTA